MAAILLLLLALLIINGAISFILRMLTDIRNSITDKCSRFWFWITSPLRPKPLEGTIDNPNYYRPTEEAPKRYDKSDGIKTSFKRVK